MRIGGGMRKRIVLTVGFALLFASCIGIPSRGLGISFIKYMIGEAKFQSGEYEEALNQFEDIDNYKDSSMYIMYIRAIQLAEKGEYLAASENFSALAGFKDSILMSTYFLAKEYESEEEYEQAMEVYSGISAFSDSAAQIEMLKGKIALRDYKSAEELITQEEYDTADVLLSTILYYTPAAELQRKCKYLSALKAEENHDVSKAYDLYVQLGTYEDCLDRIKLINGVYDEASIALENNQYDLATEYYKRLGNYKDSPEKANQAQYAKAESLYSNGEIDGAIGVWKTIMGYSDSKDRIGKAYYQIANEYSKLEYPICAAMYYWESGKYSDFAQVYTKSMGINSVIDLLLEQKTKSNANSIIQKYGYAKHKSIGTSMYSVGSGMTRRSVKKHRSMIEYDNAWQLVGIKGGKVTFSLVSEDTRDLNAHRLEKVSWYLADSERPENVNMVDINQFLVEYISTYLGKPSEQREKGYCYTYWKKYKISLRVEQDGGIDLWKDL